MMSLSFSVIPVHKNIALLQEKYFEKGLSIRQISHQSASSKEAVRQGLLRAGVALREEGKPHGRPSHAKFGRRLEGGNEVTRKTEQKVINAIRELRGQNMTLRQITATLSQLGIPTKCRGKGWHPEMVRRIIVAADASLATACDAHI